MNRLLAITARGQEMIDKLQRAYEKLEKIVDRQQEINDGLQRENRRLKELKGEYKKRPPSTVEIKEGKA
ncbi:MAG: hypothetical protein QXQ46_10565 [Thermoplasmatales archaeon]